MEFFLADETLGETFFSAVVEVVLNEKAFKEQFSFVVNAISWTFDEVLLAKRGVLVSKKIRFRLERQSTMRKGAYR